MLIAGGSPALPADNNLTLGAEQHLVAMFPSHMMGKILFCCKCATTARCWAREIARILSSVPALVICQPFPGQKGLCAVSACEDGRVWNDCRMDHFLGL